MTEQWRDVIGFEGLYQVSSLGEIKSLLPQNPGRILKSRLNPCGYPMLGLMRGGRQYTVRVHRVVAEAFIPNPDDKPTVNHKNEDKTDNRIENLEWMTVRENDNHGTRNERMGLKHRNTMCKEVLQFDSNRLLVKTWPSIREIQRHLGYDEAYLSRCCLGKCPTAYGYLWQYAS